MNDCDVVIVNYNAGHLLARCVASVLPYVARVVVVDNASADDSIARLRREHPGEAALEIVSNPDNLGFAAACNIGLTHCSAGSVLFLNPDSVVEPETIGRLLEALRGDTDVGVVGGLLLNPDGSEQRGGRRRLPSPGLAFVQAFGLDRFSGLAPRLIGAPGLHEQPLPDHPVAVEAISGACMLVRREALDDVGNWDEGYFLHCEDLDWCMRFQKKGWRILFVPAARVVHEWGACSAGRPFFVEWHKHRGMLRFYRKFHRRSYPVLLWWAVVAGVWARFAIVSSMKGVASIRRNAGTRVG